MLEIQMSTDRDALRARMINKIKALTEMKGQRIYVLVPGQASFTMNRDICRLVGMSPENEIEVMDFERMMRLVYRDCGGKKEHLDDGGRLIAMSQALNDQKKTLRVFGSSATRPEFCKTMLAEYESMQLNGVTALDLVPNDESKEKLTKLVVQKLEDLHDIFARYEDICSETKNDPADELDTVREIIDETGWAKHTHWFIDGFSDFPKQQGGLLCTIINACDSMLVSLIASGEDDEHPGRKMAAMTAKALGGMSSKPYEITHVEPTFRSDDHRALVYIQDHLCEMSPVTKPAGISSAGEAINFFCDTTAYQELLHTAGEIQKSIRSGKRFRDMSVVLCDYDKYAPIAETVFHRYGIPAYFGSDKVEIGKNPIMASVFSALDAVTRGMPLEFVLQYLKSGINPLTVQESDALETYARVWNIHGRGWAPDDDGWTMNPSGYGVDETLDDIAALSTLNELREKSIKPLLALKDDMEKSGTVGQYVMALYNFLEATSFTERVQGIIDNLVENGDRQSAMQFSQVSDVLNHSMEQMYDTLGDTERNAQDFVKLFRLICFAYKIATIPATLDQVQVMSIQDARFVCSKHRFILGCEEGVFPSYPVEIGIFDNAEIDALGEVGISIPGGIDDVTTRSLAEINTVLLGAKEKLVLSYSSDPAEPTTPSHLVLRAFQMFPEIEPKAGCGENRIYDADLLSPDMAGRLLGRIGNRQTYENIVWSLGMVENREMQATADRVFEKASWELGDLSRASVKGLYGERIPLTATRADVYASCRYHYFLKYGLALRDRPRGKSDAPAFGRFAHYVLEKTIREVEEKHGGFKDVDEKEIEKLTRKHIAAYTKEFMKGLDSQPERYAYLYRRNCRELITIMANIYRELKDSEFRCSAFELKIGGEGADVPGVKVAGDKFSGMYTGIADRVDMCEVNGKQYVRVVDYKTGKSREFDPTDILCGLSMQILMEQAALREIGYTPADGQAGVLYVPAKDPVVATATKVTDDKVIAEYEKMTTRHGMLIDDKEVLSAMEPIEGGKAHYLPIKFAADGTVSGDVCTPEQMDMLNDFTKRMMSGMIDGIGSGDVHANPISRGPERNACTYCPMKSVCHKDACGIKFRYRKQVSREEFWNEIAK